MKRYRCVLSILLVFSVAMASAACGKKNKTQEDVAGISRPYSATDSQDTSVLTGSWEFSYIIKDNWSQSRQEWETLNKLDESQSVPVPTFSCKDGSSCVLQLNGKEHGGSLVPNSDGTFDIVDENGKTWGSVSVEGKRLRVELGDGVATVNFENT